MLEKISFTEKEKQAILIVINFASQIKWGEFDQFAITRYDNNLIPDVYGQNMQLEEYSLSINGLNLLLDDMNETIDWMNDSETKEN